MWGNFVEATLNQTKTIEARQIRKDDCAPLATNHHYGEILEIFPILWFFSYFYDTSHFIPRHILINVISRNHYSPMVNPREFLLDWNNICVKLSCFDNLSYALFSVIHIGRQFNVNTPPYKCGISNIKMRWSLYWVYVYLLDGVFMLTGSPVDSLCDSTRSDKVVSRTPRK